MKNDERLGIRCPKDWLDAVKAKAAEKGETVTQYVTTCIALGEQVRAVRIEDEVKPQTEVDDIEKPL